MEGLVAFSANRRKESALGHTDDCFRDVRLRLVFGIVATRNCAARILREFFVAFLAACGAVGISAHAEPPNAIPANAQHDATLRAVWFLDADRGWAVGDRGVIWRTLDGGRSWHLQPSGVTCRLDDIAFSRDGRVGCIVGGWIEPYTGISMGVVLRSTDAGQTWTLVPTPTLPALFKITFVGPEELVALCLPSSLYPSGVLRSSDGGRSWKGLAAGTPGHVVTGDFSEASTGVVATEDGRLLSVAGGRFTPARSAPVGWRTVRAISLQGQRGWLVGDQGLVMKTTDGGLTWQQVLLNLPEGVPTACDFYTVAWSGAHCWIAGQPGTIVIYSQDDGKSWKLASTGQRQGLKRLYFLDERRGWAVGNLGMILGTRDGGQTWWTMRSGGDRLAALGIWTDAETTPWEWLAWYAADQGYLVGWIQVANRQNESDRTGWWNTNRRIEEAFQRIGTTWFDPWPFCPLPRRGISFSEDGLLQRWTRASDRESSEALLRYLVRQVRTARPALLIVPEAGPAADPADRLVQRLALKAIERAADATAFPELTAAGVSPWQVSHVITIRGNSESVAQGEMPVSVQQLSAQLGSSLDEYSGPSRALASALEAPSTGWSGSWLLGANIDTTLRDPFAALRSAMDGSARRPAVAPVQTDVQALSRAVEQRRRGYELIRYADARFLETSLAAQLSDLTGQLPVSARAALLDELAKRHQQAGQWEAAAATYQALFEQCPDHELALRAAAWLVRCYASAEITWQLQRSSSTLVVEDKFRDRQAAPTPNTSEVPEPTATVRWQVLPHHTPTRRAQRALDYASRVAERSPTLYHDPHVRLPWAAAQRVLGQGREAQNYIDWLAVNGLDAAWRATGQAEQWLRHGQGLPPKPTALCNRAPSPPYLDGDLQDEVWQQSPTIELHSPLYDDQDWSASAQLAADDQFLYLAVRVKRTNQDAYGTLTTMRRRDTPLSDHDRIQIVLDVDRDYATYYLLEIDHRGWASDQCWGSSAWDPTWYIAVRDDGTRWTIEAAIPWEELVPEAPKQNAAWAFQIQRIAPRTGLQSWATPADTQPLPQGFGLLIFR